MHPPWGSEGPRVPAIAPPSAYGAVGTPEAGAVQLGQGNRGKQGTQAGTPAVPRGPRSRPNRWPVTCPRGFPLCSLSLSPPITLVGDKTGEQTGVPAPWALPSNGGVRTEWVGDGSPGCYRPEQAQCWRHHLKAESRQSRGGGPSRQRGWHAAGDL